MILRERLARRFQYIKYCYQSLTVNHFRLVLRTSCSTSRLFMKTSSVKTEKSDDPIDVCLESLLVPIGKLSEATLVKVAFLFIPFVHLLVLGTAHVFLIDMAQYWSKCAIFAGYYILVQILFNYNLACFSDPGKVSRAKIRTEFAPCKKCTQPRPPRTHHCSSCGECILGRASVKFIS